MWILIVMTMAGTAGSTGSPTFAFHDVKSEAECKVMAKQVYELHSKMSGWNIIARCVEPSTGNAVKTG
jgi:hypothetical protein